MPVWFDQQTTGVVVLPLNVTNFLYLSIPADMFTYQGVVR